MKRWHRYRRRRRGAEEEEEENAKEEEEMERGWEGGRVVEAGRASITLASQRVAMGG